MFSKIIYRDYNNSTERPTQRPTDVPPPSSSTVTPNIVVIKWEFFILGIVVSIVLVLAIWSIIFLCKKRNRDNNIEVRGHSRLGDCVVRWIPCLSGSSVPNQTLINQIDEAFATNENAPILIGGDRISNSQVIIDNPPEQDVEVVNIVASSTIIQPAFTNTWTKKNFIALFSKKTISEMQMQPPAPPNTPLNERPQSSQNTISQNAPINDIEY